MIFVTVGSTDISFSRLIAAIDRIVEAGLIKENVFGQIGCSKYTPKNFEYKDFLSKKEFDDYYERADLIIGHAGMGSIMMALDMNKPLLIVPRLRQYKEHVNDHQLLTAKKFEEMKHVVALYDIESNDSIIRKIKEAKDFKPIRRKSMANEIAIDINSYLLELEKGE